MSYPCNVCDFVSETHRGVTSHRSQAHRSLRPEPQVRRHADAILAVLGHLGRRGEAITPEVVREVTLDVVGADMGAPR